MKEPIITEICPALAYQSDFYALDSAYFRRHKMAFLSAMIRNRIHKVTYEDSIKMTLPQRLFTKKLSKDQRTVVQRIQQEYPIRFKIHSLDPDGALEEIVKYFKKKWPEEIFYISYMFTQSYAKKPLIDNPLLRWKPHASYQYINDRGKVQNSDEEVLKLDKIDNKDWLTIPYKKRDQLVKGFADEECKFFGHINPNLLYTLACPTQNI